MERLPPKKPSISRIQVRSRCVRNCPSPPSAIARSLRVAPLTQDCLTYDRSISCSSSHANARYLSRCVPLAQFLLRVHAHSMFDQIARFPFKTPSPFPSRSMNILHGRDNVQIPCQLLGGVLVTVCFFIHKCYCCVSHSKLAPPYMLDCMR